MICSAPSLFNRAILLEYFFNLNSSRVGLLSIWLFSLLRHLELLSVDLFLEVRLLFSFLLLVGFWSIVEWVLVLPSKYEFNSWNIESSSCSLSFSSSSFPNENSLVSDIDRSLLSGWLKSIIFASKKFLYFSEAPWFFLGLLAFMFLYCNEILDLIFFYAKTI